MGKGVSIPENPGLWGDRVDLAGHVGKRALVWCCHYIDVHTCLICAGIRNAHQNGNTYQDLNTGPHEHTPIL